MVKSKTNLRLLLFVGAVLLASSGMVFAQSTGDYRSMATGDWSAVGTWQEYNGSAWAAASTVPPNTANITISAADTVTVDVADSTSGTLVIDGYMKDVAGFKAKGTVTVNNGATYELAHNGSSSMPGIPTATWNTGSTCLITGKNDSLSSTTNFNASQDFYNLLIKSTFTSNKDLGMYNNTINGTFLLNSNSSSQVRLTSPGAGSPNTITFNGPMYIMNGEFSTNGSGSAADITINDHGNVIVTGGNFSISRGSGPTVMWNFYGDSLTISNAQTKTSGSSNAFVFAKKGTQYMTLDNATYGGGGIPVLVDTGATLDLGTSQLGGDGMFTMDSGAVLATGNAGGIDSTIQTTGTITYSSGASFMFNGTSAQMTGSKLPAMVRNLAVDNSSGVTLSKSVTVSDTLMFMSGNLMLDTNYVMASAVTGASSSSYAVTDTSAASFKVPNVGSSKVLFPVGTSAEGYSPVWITNSGTVDTMSVVAQPDASPVAGIGRVNVKWNIAENNSGANCTIAFGWTKTAENSTFSAYREAYSYIYNINGSSFTQAGSGSYTTQFSSSPYSLSRSGISTLGTFAVGKFVVNLTAKVGDYGTVKSGNWDSLSTWMQWNGSSWATAPSMVPQGVVNVFINKNDTVVVTGVDSVGGNLVVDGYIRDQSGLKTGGTVVFDSASTFELAHNGGSDIAGIPTATWKTGSTCLITGKNDSLSSTTGFNTSQDFYNLIINSTFTSNKDLGMYNNTISGMLMVNSNSSSQIRLTSPGAGTPNTITIMGPLYLKAGEFSSNGSGSPADITINDHGNIYVTGGVFSISRGSGPTVNWNFYGDSLSIANAQTKTSGLNDAFVFAKKGMQYIKFDNLSFGGGGMPVVVDSGATLVMGLNSWAGDGIFAVDSGATIVSGDTTGLDGNIATSGTVAISSGASFVFNGAVAQTTGLNLPSTASNLTINNIKGVTLSKNVTLTGTLTMSNGNLRLDTNNVTAASVSGGSLASFVNTDSAKSFLKVTNVGKTQKLFPVGTKAEGYSPVWITNTGTVDDYTVSAMPDTATVNGGGRVNVGWNIGEGTPGGSNLTLQFGWMSSAQNKSFSSDPSGNAKIYLLADTGNTEEGSGSYQTQLSSQPYTVSRGGITTVGTFGVGNFTKTGIEQSQVVPAVFKLYQNYPNPFNPSTKIEFTVAKKGETSLTIYNVLGQKVMTLFSEQAQPGKKYMVQFDASRFASGVYFSVLQSNSERQIKKMVLMK